MLKMWTWWRAGKASLVALVAVALLCSGVQALPYALPLPNTTQTCWYGISLEWSTRVASSVFATPAIADLSHDGKREILVPTFSQYLEAVNGANGEDVPGYPFVHPKLKSYASPLPVDIDGDGKIEWLVAMYTGELLLFNAEGKARGLLKVPPLAVKKNWKALRTDVTPIDRLVALRAQVPQMDDAALEEVMRARRMDNLFFFSTMGGADEEAYEERRRQYQANHDNKRRAATAAAVTDGDDAPATDEPAQRTFEQLSKHEPEPEQLWQDELEDDGDDGVYEDDDDADGRARQAEDDAINYGYPPPPRGEFVNGMKIGPHGRLSAEGKKSLHFLFHSDMYRTNVVFDEENDAFNAHHLRGKMKITVQEDEVAVDAHLLSTPRIVDIDGNGDLDVIMHVSYFFDAEEYAAGTEKRTLLGDVNPNDFLATGVLCMNLVTSEVKWLHLLHLTSAGDKLRAFALSSPLIVNADQKDNGLEVYAASSTGSLVGISGDGKSLKGWPVFMGPMAASPSAEDLRGNGEVNICVGDIEGKVKCFTPTGAVLWETSVIGAVSEQITFGDVNGDGQVDVVFGTSSGYLYALDGQTGAPLPHFPFITGGPIAAPATLLNLDRIKRPFFGKPTALPSLPPLAIVFPSHDGKVYIIDGHDGCAETIDVDEKSSSMVLADDLTGNGHIDLLVSTISGGLFVFETDTHYHPMRTWTSKVKGLNGYTAGESSVGVYVIPSYRRPRDVRGDRFNLKIDIRDSRSDVKNPRYHVMVYIGARTRVFAGVFTQPGVKLLKVRTPFERLYSSVTVVMTLPSGMVYTDTISLSFNMHFLSTIKYLLVLPFFLTCAALMLVQKRHEVTELN